MAGPAEVVALLLDREDRETALGDLEEQGLNSWAALIVVLDFVIRQHAEYWRDWRPWLAGTLVIPVTLLLLGASFQLSLDSRNLWHGGNIQVPLACETLLTVIWAWTSGFAVGSLAKRTSWISLILSTLPCIFCVLRFREPSLESACLLLFFPPAILGAAFGRRRIRLTSVPALALAIVTTGTMLLWHDFPPLHWLLSLPAWHLVLASEKFRVPGQVVSHHRPQ
jgi:hypothetical protein